MHNALDGSALCGYFARMALEDHAGDVIRKSRIGLGISSQELCKIARIDEQKLARFEENGNAESMDLSAIAKCLRLDFAKLMKMASGWEPAQHDLHRWKHLRQIETDEGGMAVNCFLIWDESGEAALFDTGWNFSHIHAIVNQFNLHLKHLCITHSHTDHIAALNEVQSFAPKAILHSAKSGGETGFQIGKLSVSSRQTPGHAEDGITFLISGFPEQMPDVAIVGDAIFAGSIGGVRNHFELARETIRQQILSLPMTTLLCPGHGPATTVQEEWDHNPFFTFD